MHAKGDSARTFSTPSPGEILKRSPPRKTLDISAKQKQQGTVDIAGDPFQADHQSSAWKERGVMLAPLIVIWQYKIPAARPFAKWLRTKEMLLSDARLGIQDATRGVHYFGTYIASSGADTEERGIENRAKMEPFDCQTIWGFSERGSMDHMFELCRGNVERATIVENDLREFVSGLKGHISEAGSEHFSQQVLVTPATF